MILVSHNGGVCMFDVNVAWYLIQLLICVIDFRLATIFLKQKQMKLYNENVGCARRVIFFCFGFFILR